ncbi:MAG: ATP cone domain-containing protein, partial [Oscillospiraceae bacterium]|nr:ATP cone domain-containing protein [Oscillospiraceae bacterium]
MPITSIKKRDGRVAEFDIGKIAEAIGKAFDATYRTDNEELSAQLAGEVISILEVEGNNS